MNKASNKDSIFMPRLKSTLALLILAVPLTGAAAAGGDGWRDRNASLYSTNQPVVQRTDYVIDLSASGGGLSSGEQARLASWFESLGIGSGDRVFVEADRYAGERARADVAAVAGDYGLLLHDGAPITEGNADSGYVRVIVSRTTASVPGCPKWERQYGASTATSSNYGCAVNSNLAAMIADPNDLVLGQTGSLAGGQAAGVKAIESYRKKAPTGAGNLKPAGGN